MNAARKLGLSLRRQSKLEGRRLAKRAQAAAGALRTVVDVRPLLEALADPEHCNAATRVSAVAYATAQGGQRTDCFACGQPWTMHRPPIAMVQVHIFQIKDRIAGGICGECIGSGALLRQRVLETVERIGFQEDPHVTLIEAEGRA